LNLATARLCGEVREGLLFIIKRVGFVNIDSLRRISAVDLGEGLSLLGFLTNSHSVLCES